MSDNQDFSFAIGERKILYVVVGNPDVGDLSGADWVFAASTNGAAPYDLAGGAGNPSPDNVAVSLCDETDPVPNPSKTVKIVIPSAVTRAQSVGSMSYGVWRTDAGNEGRLADGTLTIKSAVYVFP